jgi:hypothetical protein
VLKIIGADRSKRGIEFIRGVRKEMFDAGQTEPTDVFIGHAQPVDEHRLEAVEENVMVLFEFLGHLKDVQDVFEEIAEEQAPRGDVHERGTLPLGVPSKDGHFSQRRGHFQEVRTDERLQPWNDDAADQIDRESMADALEGQFQHDEVLIDDFNMIVIGTREYRIGHAFDHVGPDVEQMRSIVNRIEIVGQLPHVAHEFQFEGTKKGLLGYRQVKVREERRGEIREGRIRE